MLYSNLFSTLAFLTLSAAASVPPSKVLSLPVNRVKIQGTKPSDFNDKVSKHTSGEVTLKNRAFYYSVDVELGTPGQMVTALIDTGSSDLWVDNHAFDSSKSSTFKNGTESFFIEYLDQSFASGTYVQDSVGLGGVTVQNGNWALATKESADNTYVFGVSIPAQEAASQPYDNIPIQLKKQGIIESVAFSLWLNDYSDNEGSILFGGVDHSRYQGSLGKLPIVGFVNGGESQITDLAVTLNSIGLSNNGKSGKIVDGAALPAILDSGTTFGLLPDDWINAIYHAFDATYDSELQDYIVINKPSSGTIDFEFSGVTVNVPLESFIRPYYDNNGNVVQRNGEDVYEITLQSTGSSGVDISGNTYYILGDGFLSGAYAAFDLDNNVIGLANANLGNVGDGNIEAIGADGIPGTDAPGYATATVTHTSYSLHTPTGIL